MEQGKDCVVKTPVQSLVVSVHRLSKAWNAEANILDIFVGVRFGVLEILDVLLDHLIAVDVIFHKASSGVLLFHPYFKKIDGFIKACHQADLVVVIKLCQRVLLNMDGETSANSEAIL
jgi:hypothetical protein